MAQNSVTPFDDPRLHLFHGGFVPTPRDSRQLIFAPFVSAARKAAARTNHDLRDFGPTHQNMCMPVNAGQQQVGSCAAWTWGYEVRGMLTARYHILNGTTPDLNDTLAPRFIYDVGRGPEFMNTYPQDSGMDMRSGAAVLLKYGCPPEHILPYQNSANNGALSAEITPTVLANAAYYGVSGYYQCDGTGPALIDNILLALDQGYPVAIAVLVPGRMQNGQAVSSSFEQIGPNGRIPMPAPGEVPIGGHAITVVANFIDNSFAGGGCFLIQNHWTPSWGEGGFGYLPFAYFTTSSGRYGLWGQEGWVVN